ncbi:MAG: DUF2029 domain-containing protein [Bacteroidota bacterium]|nr:DUF2029 domain-containing protein [Bacteroidota bacterium]
MIEKQNNILASSFFWACILFVITLLLSLQNLLLDPKTFYPGGAEYTHYNNYLIFKQSFFHLVENKDLYHDYPAEHWDYYKYSPTFSLFMAPFAVLPDAAGLLAWNLLNVLVLFYALWKLPAQTGKARLFILGFILIELLSSIHNSQSNALLAGLILFAFIALEKKRTAIAALLIVLTIFIKIFGLVALCIFIFYPHKLKAILYTICWTILFAALPLLFISASQLTFLYHSWLDLLKNDHSMSVGFSVGGWLYSWFGIEAKNLTVIIGAALLLIPLLNFKYFNELKYRLWFLSSILIWMVIFNHKAEQPTFIIAVAGIAIWFFSQKFKIENIILLALVFVFTVLSATGIFEQEFREKYIEEYVLKAVPCILVWFKITADLLFYKPEKELKLSWT